MHTGGFASCRKTGPVYFVTWRPGPEGSGRFGYWERFCCVALASASSRTREKQQITTDFAPARFSARTQASLVAPLVSTSSIRRISRPSSRAAMGARTLIAPPRIFARALAPIPPRLGVALVRSSASTTILPRPARSSSRPSKAAWLKPRVQRRQRCRGTGTISRPSGPAGTRAAMSRASKGARPILRPCLNPRTSLRETSVYSVPAAIPS